jgi:MscS family membrane protein
VANWKWAGLLLAVLVALLIMAAMYRIHDALADRYSDKRPWQYGLTIVVPICTALVPLALRDFVYEYLTLRGTPLYILSFLANLTSLLIFLLVVFAAGNRIAAFILASPRINPKGLDAQFIRIVSRLLSIVVAVVIFLEGGQRLGIPVSTLLASAGVGGLAIALSAQDMVKSLFGTIMLLMDKPFRVGERIIFGKYDGVVEDIGLRSTRLRLLTGHQATIPNDELARSDIENVGRRQFIRRSAMLELPSGTPVAKVNRALTIVKTILENHDGMTDDYPPRIFLQEFKESSIGVMFMYWYHPPEYWAFLAFSERVNLQIMEQLEAEHIPFAAPALTVQMPDQDK